MVFFFLEERMLMSTDQCFRSGVVMWWGGRDWGWGDCSGSMRRLWWPQVTGGARRHLAELFWFLFLLHQDRDHSETRERPRKVSGQCAAQQETAMGKAKKTCEFILRHSRIDLFYCQIANFVTKLDRAWEPIHYFFCQNEHLL